VNSFTEIIIQQTLILLLRLTILKCTCELCE